MPRASGLLRRSHPSKGPILTETKDRPTVEEPSQQDINEKLNDLLSRWHAHCSGYTAGKGYPSGDAVCRQANSSSHWDWWNGSMDKAVDSKVMAAFDAVMWNIPQPYLTALQFQARNLFTGKQVWTSPRLPKDEYERTTMLIEARNILLKALARNGVMN